MRKPENVIKKKKFLQRSKLNYVFFLFNQFKPYIGENKNYF